ncbi:MAG: type I methionyl aminopeptidase [Caldilineaceae bacterium]|nr:type I methionyl aminopeptidase [Caldilineaceae bacterium]
MFQRGQQRFLRKQLNTPPRNQPVLKSQREIQIMREAGRVVARVHEAMREAVQPGVSTWDLDQIALEVMQKYNAVSAFLGYRGYPAHICTSVNEELVHGIPNKDKVLRGGDIISIDIGVRYRGFIGDSAWSYAVGEIDEKAAHLLRVTEASLYAGIEQMVVGNRIVDASRAVQQVVENAGLHVVREYTGHGVGRQMHEPPQVLNYVGNDPDGNLVLEPGLVVAIEPMVQVGTWQTRTLRDEWTVISKDHSLTAHFEHTVAVTHNGPEVLTLP